MSYRLLIFDLDGTISDPSEGITASVNHALAAYGYEPADPDRIRSLIGPPLTDIFHDLLGDIADRRMLELVASYRERYSREGYAENVIYPEIARTLDRLAGSGVDMGVCTSKRGDYAGRILEMFGIDDYFSFVDGGDVHITKAMQLQRLVANGLDATSAVMIGDRAVDIEAAKANGIASAGVCWGFGSCTELQSAGPDHLLETPPELFGLRQ